MAMTVDEILEAMRALVAAAEEAEEPLSDEDANRYEELEKQLAVARRSQEIAKRMAAYDSPRNDVGVHVAVPKVDDGLERAFNHYLRTGQVNQDIMELRAQGEGVGSEGGFTVPGQFRQKLVDRMVAFGGVANEAEIYTTGDGRPVEWVTLDDTSSSGAIVAEQGSPASGADLVFGQKTLNAHKYMATGADGNPLRLSFEVAQDSTFDLAGLVANKLGERIARAQAVDLITGTGVGEPEGILNKAGGEALGADTLTYADLVAMIHDVDPAYRTNSCVWLMHDGTLEVIRGLVDGQSRPLWLPEAQSGLGTLAGGTLLGHRVVIDQAMPNLVGSATGDKCLVFGDIREGFVVRRVKDVTVVVDPYTRMSQGQVQYIAWARMDSCIQNPHSFTIATAA